MRVVKNGDVHVSAPIGMPRAEVVRFVREHRDWIAKARKKTDEQQKRRVAFYDQLPLETKVQADEALERLKARVEPMVESHAEEMGLDIDNNLILVRPLNAEDGFNMMKEFIDSGEVGLVIIDSVSAMSSKAAVEGDAFSGFAGGKTAAAISMGIKMLIPYLYNNK